MHVVLCVKAEVHDRAALSRAALAALERVRGRPADEHRQALTGPALALYELLWASHPTAGPRRAEALGFEVVASDYETHDPPDSIDGPARANDKEVTFFQSEGTGLQFAAVSKMVYDRARDRGLGRELPAEWFLQDIRT